MTRIWILLAGLAGLTGVAAGAFAAHGLSGQISASGLDAFRRGTDYQLFHALLLLAIAWLSEKRAPLANWAGGFTVLGILLFCGSLYLLPVTHAAPVVISTPVGGTCFLIAWGLILVSGLSLPRETP